MECTDGSTKTEQSLLIQWLESHFQCQFKVCALCSQNSVLLVEQAKTVRLNWSFYWSIAEAAANLGKQKILERDESFLEASNENLLFFPSTDHSFLWSSPFLSSPMIPNIELICFPGNPSPWNPSSSLAVHNACLCPFAALALALCSSTSWGLPMQAAVTTLFVQSHSATHTCLTQAKYTDFCG